jgi:hypothetical protein
MRSLSLALLAAAACASARETAPPPSPFLGVRSLVLVRSLDDRTHRPKDPLDGLDETLRARGFATRLVELRPGHGRELDGLDRLFGQLEARAGAGRTERMARPITSGGEGAASAVAALGVDAVASYHRFERRRPAELRPEPLAGAPFSPAGPPAQPRAAGALALVDREGRVATFTWGDAIDDAAMPANPAEAIELLVRALTGEGAEE